MAVVETVEETCAPTSAPERKRVTRGAGLLEGFLAERRAKMATKLLHEVPRSGRILDVGCGSLPFFLLESDFAERVGIDKTVAAERAELDGVRLLHKDFERDPSLPFDDKLFDAVTMLAVFEHIEPENLTPLLAEIRRVLRPEGILVITTPASWTDPILKTLARLGLVSSEEIDEHKDAYSHAAIRRFLVDAGFDAEALRFGSFELGMNLWATAKV